MGDTLRVVRVSRSMPNVLSSAATVRLSADWDTPNWTAARVKLRSRAAKCKDLTSRPWSVGVDRNQSKQMLSIVRKREKSLTMHAL